MERGRKNFIQNDVYIITCAKSRCVFKFWMSLSLYILVFKAKCVKKKCIEKINKEKEHHL